MPRKPDEGAAKPNINFSYLECLLYSLHALAARAPTALNPLFGFRITTGQPSDDVVGEGREALYEDFRNR